MYDRTCTAPTTDWGTGAGVCGRAFEARRSDAQYCSPACRKRASRARGTGRLREQLRSLRRSLGTAERQADFYRTKVAGIREELAHKETELNGQLQVAL